MAERDTAAAASDAVVVEVGNEELEHGRVRAELRANGTLHVTRMLEGKQDSFEHKVGPEEAGETIRRADSLARLAPRRERAYRPVPDEALYRIELVSADESPIVVEVWQNELDEHEEARRLVQQLGEQVERASDGRAIL
jgi:hypothetical protein